MSGKIKIGGLVLAAALVVLGAWFAFGQATQDPCGGKYAGEGLKALFWPNYKLDTQNPNAPSYPCNILNDLPYLQSGCRRGPEPTGGPRGRISPSKPGQSRSKLVISALSLDSHFDPPNFLSKRPIDEGKGPRSVCLRG